eukprot:55274-Pyramimonas_sp.AAC.1
MDELAVFGSREGVAAVIFCGSRSGFGPRPFSRKGGEVCPPPIIHAVLACCRTSWGRAGHGG